MNARVLLKRSFLTDADVHGAPCPHARRDVDPRPSRTAIPGGQEHPLAIKEAAETEMASVLEKVAAYYAAMVEVLVLAFAVAIFEAVTFFAFVAVVQFALVALREAIIISAVVSIRVHVCRRPVVNVSGRAAISHTRSARAALGTKARARSTAAGACTTAKAWSTATTCMRSNASTAATASTSAATATVMALRVSAAREDERQGRCDYKFPHWLTSFIC